MANDRRRQPALPRCALPRLQGAGVELRLAAPVARLHRDERGVTVEVGGVTPGEHRFDRVVVATHADTALALIDGSTSGDAVGGGSGTGSVGGGSGSAGGGATDAERQVLGAFRYSKNRTVLHGDVRFLPRNPRAHASWNYVSDGDASRVAVTYSMNLLQGHPADTPLLVTLNPRQPIDSAKQLCEVELTHPQFDAAALRAQRALPALQGTRRTYYAGAHLGFGFHEDGMRSGMDAAAALWRDEQRADRRGDQGDDPRADPRDAGEAA